MLQIGLVAVFGWLMVPFLAVHNFFAWWQLTSANYIEHYGLLRKRNANGTFEHCQPYHSWNANHVASNVVLFHLERHSDHHAHPTRRYQTLRSFPDLPSLPNGYMGMYFIAMFPPLWSASWTSDCCRCLTSTATCRWSMSTPHDAPHLKPVLQVPGPRSSRLGGTIMSVHLARCGYA